MNRVLAVAMLGGLVVSAAAHAAGTQFKGKITVSMNITLSHPLTGSQSLYCSAGGTGGDAGQETFKGQTIIPAQQRTATDYTCSAVVPYNWIDQNVSGDQMDVQITYEAVILDANVAFNNLGLGLFSASGNFKVQGLTAGQNINYATPISLY